MLNLTYADAILKDLYPQDSIEKLMNTDTPFLDKIEKSSKEIQLVGRKAIVPIKHANNQGYGARAEGGTLPRAGYQKFSDTTLTLKYNYGKARLSGQTIKATQNNKGAFVSAIVDSVSDCIEGLRKDLSRQVWGNQSGILGRVLSANNSTKVIVLDQPVEDVCKYIKEGMRIDIKTAVGGTEHGTSLTVASVDPATNSFTVGSSDTISSVIAEDVVFREDSDGYEMTGVRGIVDDGTELDPLQGLARSTYPWWKCAYRGTATKLAASVFRNLIKQVRKIDGKRSDLAFWTTFDIEDKLAEIMAVDRRFSEAEVDGGFKVITFNKIPIYSDDDMWTQQLYLLAMKSFVMAALGGFDWVDNGRGIWLPAHLGTSGVDEYEATLCAYREFCTFNARVNAVETAIDATL